MGERGRFTAFVLRRANLELARRVGIAIVLAAGSTACGGADDDVLGPGAAGAGGATEGIAGQSSWIGQSGAGGAGGAADAGVPRAVAVTALGDGRADIADISFSGIPKSVVEDLRMGRLDRR